MKITHSNLNRPRQAVPHASGTAGQARRGTPRRTWFWTLAAGGLLPLCGSLVAPCWAAEASADKVFSQKVEVSPARTPDPANPGQQVKDQFNVLPGFQVEKLFTVPKDTLGSWVCITTDNKGRLLVSDQGGKGICRVTPPAIGSTEPTKVELLDLKLSSAQGMLWAFDSLYLSINGGPGSGLYRARDTNGDDQFDEVVKLKDIRGGGEHGPHALRLSPDGKSILVNAGNHTLPPFELKRSGEPQIMGGIRPDQLHVTLPEGASSRLQPNWDEDLLLPRQWDANGHAAGILAPGGWLAKTDPDGKTWEMFTVGYRNSYDMAHNADGELFVYDSDMEWDMGMPWYRPTRVTHATSGSEFGWRSGTGVWPSYYLDSLPELVNVGPGSPVGVEFGYGTKFPAKYQQALYILDWTFGTIYAIHNEPNGATYKAVKEEFLSRTPLPLTDAVVGKDGALYFTVGGRGTQSELFRVTYTGTESTAPAELKQKAGAEARALRHKIEEYHRPAQNQAEAVAFLLPHLKSGDRYIRYAARVALEFQDLKLWQDKALAETDVNALLTGVVGLARQADKPLQPQLIAALEKLNYGSLSEDQQLDYLRAWSLVFIRLGAPAPELATALAKKLDTFYPAPSDSLNRELVNMLVFLQSPTVLAKTLVLLEQPTVTTPTQTAELLARNPGYGGSINAMLANQPESQKLHLVFALRNLKAPWTLEQRVTYFKWLNEQRSKKGGNSFQGFLRNMDRDAYDNASDAERLAVEVAGARTPYKAPELPKAKGPGKDYTLAELVALSTTHMKGRDFKNGRKMFAAARCVVCHRFQGDGGSTGPDLSQVAGRFGFKDLVEATIDPSKVISDQYKTVNVQTSDGKSLTGRIVSVTNDTISLLTDPEDSTKIAVIKKTDIEEQNPSPLSVMPKDLLKTLNQDEVLDLLAFLLARGNPQDPMFKK